MNLQNALIALCKLKKETFHAILVPPYSLFYLGYVMPMISQLHSSLLFPLSQPPPLSLPKCDVGHVRSFM